MSLDNDGPTEFKFNIRSPTSSLVTSRIEISNDSFVSRITTTLEAMTLSPGIIKRFTSYAIYNELFFRVDYNCLRYVVHLQMYVIRKFVVTIN